MRYKILIVSLLLALVVLPVAQAANPDAAFAGYAHESLSMDCGHIDPGHCIDFDSCMSGDLESCDTNFKATQVLAKSMTRPPGFVYTPDFAERFMSYQPELLLRPPRNA